MSDVLINSTDHHTMDDSGSPPAQQSVVAGKVDLVLRPFDDTEPAPRALPQPSTLRINALPMAQTSFSQIESQPKEIAPTANTRTSLMSRSDRLKWIQLKEVPLPFLRVDQPHLAGGMGIPVWILLPYSPDWKWITDSETTRWTGSARVYPAIPAQRLAKRRAVGATSHRDRDDVNNTDPSSIRPLLQTDPLKALTEPDWPAANEHLAMALIKKLVLTDGLLNLGLARLHPQKPRSAISTHQQGIDHNPKRPRASCPLAKAWAKAGNSEAAIEVGRNECRQFTNITDNWLSLGRTLEHMEQPEAGNAYDSAHHLAPEKPDTIWLRARWPNEHHEVDVAHRLLEAARARHPNSAQLKLQFAVKCCYREDQVCGFNHMDCRWRLANFHRGSNPGRRDPAVTRHRVTIPNSLGTRTGDGRHQTVHTLYSRTYPTRTPRAVGLPKAPENAVGGVSRRATTPRQYRRSQRCRMRTSSNKTGFATGYQPSIQVVRFSFEASATQNWFTASGSLPRPRAINGSNASSESSTSSPTIRVPNLTWNPAKSCQSTTPTGSTGKLVEIFIEKSTSWERILKLLPRPASQY
jgi:hypothetical protein